MKRELVKDEPGAARRRRGAAPPVEPAATGAGAGSSSSSTEATAATGAEATAAASAEATAATGAGAEATAATGAGAGSSSSSAALPPQPGPFDPPSEAAQRLRLARKRLQEADEALAFALRRLERPMPGHWPQETRVSTLMKRFNHRARREIARDWAAAEFAEAAAAAANNQT